MRLQPTITFEQYKATHEAISAATPKARQSYTWRGYMSLILVCLTLGLAPQFKVARVPAFTIDACLVVCWILCKPLDKSARNRRLRRVFAAKRAKLNDQVLTLDESGISYDQSNGLMICHYSWRAFACWIDMPDAFLFLPSTRSFVRVPKEGLTEEDQAQIREWSSSVPRAAKD